MFWNQFLHQYCSIQARKWSNQIQICVHTPNSRMKLLKHMFYCMCLCSLPRIIRKHWARPDVVVMSDCGAVANMLKNGCITFCRSKSTASFMSAQETSYQIRKQTQIDTTFTDIWAIQKLSRRLHRHRGPDRYKCGTYTGGNSNLRSRYICQCILKLLMKIRSLSYDTNTFLYTIW